IESAQHLFISCNLVYQIWLECYMWKSEDLHLVMPNSLDAHFWQNKGLSNSRGECAIWLVIWSAVIFCVWKLRNDAIFRQESVDKKKLVEDIKFVSWSWLNS
ncbi:hypothetical protein glysoja_049147, partial [Glycine soja]